MEFKDIKRLSYVDLMALIQESNRPPGGRDSIRRVVINSFLNKNSKVLDIGCNTGITARLISSYSKCRVVGIDLAPAMIKAAKKITKQEGFKNQVRFDVGDASDLKFSTESFDLVFSGGSIAFMEDKHEVVENAIRVLKPYGFFADILMFYRKNPPNKLINDLNSLMKIHIQKWDLAYWEKLYNNPKLELSYKFLKNFVVPTNSQISHYCHQMCKNLPFDLKINLAIEKRLGKIMNLFAENHKYLSYAVLIYQKVHQKEQISLFGK